MARIDWRQHVVEAYRYDLARVTAERDALQARLDDYYDDHRAVVDGQCAPDERHCSCVPHLRREVEAMRAVVDDACRHLGGIACDLSTIEGKLQRRAWLSLDALRARKVGG